MSNPPHFLSISGVSTTGRSVRCGPLRVFPANGASFIGSAEGRIAANSPGGPRLLLGWLAAIALAALAVLFGPGAEQLARAQADPCPNAEFRIGSSANLPDCRAYELVTPPRTGAAEIRGIPSGSGAGVDSLPVADDGNSVAFLTEPGLPGTDAAGSQATYRAVRTSRGWTMKLFGPTAAQAILPDPRGMSSDQRYMFFDTTSVDTGSLGEGNWLRHPDGTIEPVGAGSPGEAAEARMLRITPGGTHFFFSSGQGLLYDRGANGETRVISLLPGDETPSGAILWAGASQDGSIVLFTVQQTLYARLDGTETIEIAPADSIPESATLTCNPGPASAENRTFQWLRNGVPIPGATDPRYHTQSADQGKVVQCQVVVTNTNAGATQVSNPRIVVAPKPETEPPTAPTNIAAPVQSEPLTVVPDGSGGGQVLTCNPGTWPGATSFNYQWYRNGVPLSGNGANTNTYTVQGSDLIEPATFQCAVTGTNTGGSTVKVSANRATSPPPSGPTAPTASASLGSTTVKPAGISADGTYAFFEQAGNIWSVAISTRQMAEVSTSGDSALVNIAPDGSRAYFISRRRLDGTAGVEGEPNLYLWERASGDHTFIATVDPSDTTGSANLTRWSDVADGRGGIARATSRITPDGRVLIFESRAQLTPQTTGGHVAIYRYDAETRSLGCVSCRPTGEAPHADAQLQTIDGTEPRPLNPFVQVTNVTTDGDMVAFETDDALSPRDTNGAQDVYRWKAGEGVAPISSGRSARDSYLYGMTPDGRSIFFTTMEALNAGREPGVPGLYVARVNGGFPALDGPAGCSGDMCQGTPSVPPIMETPGTHGAFSSNRGRGDNALCQRLMDRANNIERRSRRARRKARQLRQLAKRTGSRQRIRRFRKRAGIKERTGRRLSRRANRLEKRAMACREGSR